ncbi:M23 family metallopeptidase [Alphaproteobacteria bacterium]|nr:M23 family metallopeptidase [Alphaproteobacteria bacterium]MDC1022955.1 M23 family metallopeptidase [Alphaproteobacteria bacterium]
MVNTTINKFGKKLPPVKTGQRFGEEVRNNKKVGLFSERRFLIFTKKGPFEIAFKPIHYTSLLITTVVGLTSILYWSAKGIYSAIDVAKKDIITEASAGLTDPIENDSDTNVSINTVDQTNISLPAIKNIIKEKLSIYQNYVSFENNIPNNKNIDNIKTFDTVNRKKSENRNDEPIKLDNSKRNQNITFKYNKEFGSSFGDSSSKKNNQLPQPPKLDKKAKSLRFLASVDNELILMENVFKSINVKLDNNDLVTVSSILNNNVNVDPDSDGFFTSLKDRLNLLAIYKDALQFIPLKPPMEHYYISSNYGKRKHPVTGKYRMHHGIDLAGTWQENVSVSADGTVVYAGYHGSFGKVIRIRHSYGIMTTYGHLAKINVKRGDIVNEGQVIGKMGRTGRVDGAHLHYEISVNGKSQNPKKFIKIGRNLLSRTSLKSFSNIK